VQVRRVDLGAELLSGPQCATRQWAGASTSMAAQLAMWSTAGDTVRGSGSLCAGCARLHLVAVGSAAGAFEAGA